MSITDKIRDLLKGEVEDGDEEFVEELRDLLVDEEVDEEEEAVDEFAIDEDVAKKIKSLLDTKRQLLQILADSSVLWEIKKYKILDSVKLVEQSINSTVVEIKESNDIPAAAEVEVVFLEGDQVSAVCRRK